jgi:hypothetical protein
VNVPSFVDDAEEPLPGERIYAKVFAEYVSNEVVGLAGHRR